MKKLARHRWSTVREAQVIAAVVGAVVMLAFELVDYFPSPFPPHTGPPPWWFWIVMLLHLPTFYLCKFLGIPSNSWLICPLLIVVNTFLCFLLGTMLGFILIAFGRGSAKEPSVGEPDQQR